ncbi:FAD-dependent oxidoreductase [Thiomicrorhabdus xiamenensis]|uniref:FAD-dependent oxidoreductase n=1 Tax=Thiomicrorhabdus xiamenensis TaxID=2739063 RepID=A0A7D4SHV4_9GAMM|nr:FAD-dependent oxidoreductase [Thiomicrorhabdus xiamenensis]QKI88800.1 FAD-dependent oxidoreductase [Thiomicrorhabdus xiamenensis]
MNNLTRRELMKRFGAAGLSLGLFGASKEAWSKSAPHIVIVGGGIGGVSAAKYLRILDKNVKITIIEPNKEYIFCPGSNEVLNDFTSIEELTVNYENIKSRYAVNVIEDLATDIDYSAKKVKTKNSGAIAYDKLIVAPGPDYKFSDIEGYSKELAEGDFPHAWKAGPQTLKLREQIHSMPQGGVVAISSPPMPYRCPPAPYERASFISEWLTRHNPTAKILILDSKNSFTFRKHYLDYWTKARGYGTKDAMIEWIPMEKGGKVTQLDAANNTLVTADGERIKADVINIIPAHTAGKFAHATGLTQGNEWVPIDPMDYRSTLDKDVFVVGDATESSPMVKTGYLASNHSKAVAQSIVNELAGKPPVQPLYTNNCVALTGEDYGMTITDTFRVKDGKIVKQYGHQSTELDNEALHHIRASLAMNWQRAFRRDIFE